MRKSIINASSTDKTIRFAAEELNRYLKLAHVPDASNHRFRMGLASDVGVALPDGLTPDQDWIHIDVSEKSGTLTGSNPRSVLFAVYRFLRELGFAWPRPEPGAELIPDLSGGLRSVRVQESPFYPIRTLCIEGACSLEHVVALIDWGAKHGLNGYFLQFEYGATFWKKWYAAEGNPHRQGTESFDIEDARDIVERLIPEIKKRGLVFERFGHGWTSRAFGFESETWSPETKTDLSYINRTVLAEIKGRRDLFEGIALNTNLCYASQEARRRVVNLVVDYAKNHPEVDRLHLWLADGTNNHCECDECRELRPADYYVRLLNEVDEALDVAGLSTRIVFLLYVDLLWPPERERLRNPGRFLLMFAPITRSYEHSFAEAQPFSAPLPDYCRNQNDFPADVGVNLAFLRAWQEWFKGPCFDFDYHLYWANYNDPNQMTLAKVLSDDIKNFEDMGLAGLNSCQIQRVGFPHNLLMAVMAETLWNPSTPYDAVRRRLFCETFGDEHAPWLEDWFERMSALWRPLNDPLYLPEADPPRREQARRNQPLLVEETERLRQYLAIGLSPPSPVHRQSLESLSIYSEILDVWLAANHAYIELSDDVEQRYNALIDHLWRIEAQVEYGLDAAYLVRQLKARLQESKRLSTMTECLKYSPISHAHLTRNNLNTVPWRP